MASAEEIARSLEPTQRFALCQLPVNGKKHVSSSPLSRTLMRMPHELVEWCVGWGGELHFKLTDSGKAVRALVSPPESGQ